MKTAITRALTDLATRQKVLTFLVDDGYDKAIDTIIEEIREMPVCDWERFKKELSNWDK